MQVKHNNYIYFNVLDHTGTPATSGYTLSITPFTFVATFDDGSSANYSKQRILWDFGDGTTSESVTATHYYNLPGWYTVKCYTLGSNGRGNESSFSQNILVKDYISDTIVLSGSKNKTETGSLQNPFTVFRFNSWQNFYILSGEYTINLHVSGNVAPLLNAEKYNSDKWGHLKPYARFETFISNPITGNIEKVPVNNLQTDNNTELYVKLDYDKTLIFCDKSDIGSCFAGTSGSKFFYYIDDLPKESELDKTVAATIYCTFDTKQFKNPEYFDKNFIDNQLSILNTVYDTNGFSLIIKKLNPSELSITSNGIDDDNNGKYINTFDINQLKFTNQKIPFVIKIKDKNQDGYVSSSRYCNVLSLLEGTTPEPYKIQIELQDKNDVKLSDINFYTNFGVLSSEEYGGYFRGYLVSDKQLNDVHIYAKVPINTDNLFLIDTSNAIIGEPQATQIHNLTIKIDTADVLNKVLDDHVLDVGLSGVYSSCVTSKKNADSSVVKYAWIVDGDRQSVKKFSINTDDTLKLVYDSFNIPENSSPSDISSDRYGNVWITLYDSVSTIRINNITNNVDKTIIPSIANNTIDFENTVTPASVDTDVFNNIWISYSNQTLSFVEKYNTEGVFLFNKIFTPHYEATELITDLNGDAWVISKDLITNSKALSSKNDKIVKIPKNGSTVTDYNAGGSLWNLTLDVNGNIWATKNINEVVKIKTSTGNIQTYTLNSPFDDNPNNYVSNLEGIACTTDDTILVIDNKKHSLQYFKSDVDRYGFSSRSIKIPKIVDTITNKIQDKITGYGDWNGFRHINKYEHLIADTVYLEGISNTFSIFNSTSGEYDIRKVNENFDALQQIKSYRFQEYLSNDDRLFDGIIGSALGTLSSNPTELGKLIYEKISNFTDNVANIDSCNLKTLKSMYTMLNEDLYEFTNNNLHLPADVNRLIDLFSIKFSKLKGSRNKFSQNFKDNGYINEDIVANGGIPIYGINKGKELDFQTTILSAGFNIIAFEKFSETYTILNTDILSSAYINFLDGYIKTYHLSSYHPYWGWGLVLPDTYEQNDITKYYKFYEYVDNYDNTQTEGIINWADKYTTISEYITSKKQWDDIRENMLVYSLAKGLGVVKY